MRTECPMCLIESLVNWWLEYDGDYSDDFTMVETAIEYLEMAMADCLFRPMYLCEIHAEEQEEWPHSEQEEVAGHA